MKICIVADVLGEPNNGTTLACLNLINELRYEGHEVRILCSDKSKKGKEGYFIVPTLYLPFLMKKLERNNVSLSKPDKRIVEESLDGVDICHLMIPFALSRAALKVCLKKGIPVTAGFHCQAENFSAHIAMMNGTFFNNAIYKNFYRCVYGKVDAIHYPTQFIKDLFEEKTNCLTKGYVISNGVNDIFKKKEDCEKVPYQILMIGRLSKEKSQETLLKAVSLSEYRDKIKLVLAGQGPRRAYLERLAGRLGIDVRMNFYPREELVKVINESELYVHSSKIEIEAISCLEAIRCGLVPVISDSPRSATGAFAIDERCRFRYDDPSDLAVKIDYWLAHPEERAAMSEAYLGFSGQFDQTACMKKMTEMFEEVIKDHEK